jgi:hypothetical protein
MVGWQKPAQMLRFCPMTNINFFDGLFRYLQVRNWAFEQMKTRRIGLPALDSEIHHYLYFANALAAVDLVGEEFYGTNFLRRQTPLVSTPYEQRLIDSFDLFLVPPLREIDDITGAEAYAYVRELRNSMVHRGQGQTAGHANEEFVFTICPSVVHNSKGTRTYRRPFRYMVQLGALCDLAFNTVIYEELDNHDTFDLTRAESANVGDILNFLDASEDVPDFAKAMARQFIPTLDFQKMGAEIAETRMRQLKALLNPRFENMQQQQP